MPVAYLLIGAVVSLSAIVTLDSTVGFWMALFVAPFAASTAVFLAALWVMCLTD